MPTNPFALLGGPDSDDEDSPQVFTTVEKKAPAAKAQQARPAKDKKPAAASGT